MAKLQSVSELENVNENLAKFDDLDFNAFSAQDWEGFHRSHSEDILVHWPDGHTTKGFAKHIEDLKYMFSFAPDTRIKTHPIKIGQGDWTAVVGIMEGTFTLPMITRDGRMISPTFKTFKINMCTVGHWRNGVMDEEYLFWDNQTYLQQLGIV